MKTWPQSALVTPIGTYKATLIPEGIRESIVNGAFIDRRNGTPMEMDAYSFYLSLKALERIHSISLENEKRRIVDAIEARRLACGGFWNHGAWTGSPEEVHYRFTAAAIKLLIEAYADGIYPYRERLLDILKQHLSYREDLALGPWFFHDSIELAAVSLSSLPGLLPNTAWQSSPRNALVLNTHADTVSLLLYFLEMVDIDRAEREALTDLAVKAIDALVEVLRIPDTPAMGLFMGFDSIMRCAVFQLASHRNRLSNWIKWRLYGFYFEWRRHVKARRPFYVFRDGYIERDISFGGTYFDYHLYNTHDLVRLALLADRQNMLSGENKRVIVQTVDAAIDYMCQPCYRRVIANSFKENGRAALVCETMLARSGLTSGFVFPEKWLNLFGIVWKTVAHTPALLGCDPFILRGRKDIGNDVVFELLNGDTFTMADRRAPVFTAAAA